MAVSCLERAGAEPPWAELDDGIRDVVRMLWHAGLEPFASCQGGGNGHAEVGWVALRSSHEDVSRVLAVAGEHMESWGRSEFVVRAALEPGPMALPRMTNVIVMVELASAIPVVDEFRHDFALLYCRWFGRGLGLADLLMSFFVALDDAREEGRREALEAFEEEGEGC